jgi:hypothetical protein
LDLVKCTWTPYNEELHESPPLQFLENIKKVKKATIAWQKKQKLKENQALLEIEQLKSWLEEEVDSNFIEEQKAKILLLEQQRNAIFIAREKEWRLKANPSGFESTMIILRFSIMLPMEGKQKI